MRSYINNLFKIKYHQTSVRTEIIAGISTFFSLSYIFIINPTILAEGGMNKSSVLFATVVVSAIATIVMGVWANKPFALAPGLEMNFYIVYFIILGLNFSWQDSLGIVFWSGILFIILTLTNIREKIIDAIPLSLKRGISASVGLFIIIIGLQLTNIIVYDGVVVPIISIINTPFSKEGLILLIGLIIAVTLKTYKINILISIILSSIVANYIGLNDNMNTTINLNSEMLSGILQLNIFSIFNPQLISAIIILFVVDFYGSIGKFIGLSFNTSILDKDNKLPKLKETLIVDGGATILGSLLGTTNVTTFVESGIGIKAGGRTGLTALVCGLLMLLFIPFAFIITFVPVIATTGTLVWIGIKSLPKPNELINSSSLEVLSITIMLLTVLLTFSLDKAMLFGFSIHIIGKLLSKQRKKINIYLLISTLIILIATILAYI